MIGNETVGGGADRPQRTFFVTFPERRQRVQTSMRFEPPVTAVRTRLRFGLNCRFETLCAWLMRRPATGDFPQISQE